MNDGLSSVDKFSYLRSLLLGSAKSAVGGFVLTSANYESAIELLKKRYGKKVAIQKALISELLYCVFKSGLMKVPPKTLEYRSFNHLSDRI